MPQRKAPKVSMREAHFILPNGRPASPSTFRSIVAAKRRRMGGPPPTIYNRSERTKRQDKPKESKRTIQAEREGRHASYKRALAAQEKLLSTSSRQGQSTLGREVGTFITSKLSNLGKEAYEEQKRLSNNGQTHSFYRRPAEAVR